ncbi:MAG: SAM-dependent methyltransferase, partial [Rhizobiales bacterium]|nr:SAM-dependent methyltransferase [Hyphomicrobiales bacterium]
MVRSIGSREGMPVNERLMALVDRVASNLRCGRLTIIGPEGTQRRFDGRSDGPDAVLQLHSWRAVRRFAVGGSLGFAEAYLDGDWDSPDLPRLLELLVLNEDAYADQFYGHPWFRWMARVRHLFRPNSRHGSRRNILAHYDLGNAFYQRWLDPSMTYSSARFEKPELSLEDAQTAKYRSLIRRLSLQP